MNPVIDKFREIGRQTRENLRQIENSPLRLGLAVLSLAKELFREEYLNAYEVSEALDRLGFNIKRDQLVRAFSKANGKIRVNEFEGVEKYKIMDRGEREIENILFINHSELIYIDAGKPYNARRKLEDILRLLSGEVIICDPYCGVNSLAALALIPRTSSIKLLTSTIENQAIFTTELTGFRVQYANVEVRRFTQPRTLHDRYILDSQNLFIIGHGIKDIGNRESFIIQFHSNVAQDIMDDLKVQFDTRWLAATPI